MSTKLNAEELASKRYPEIDEPELNAHFQDGCKVGYFFAIEEVAQPIADERDELLDFAQMVAGGGWDLSDLMEEAREVIAKATQP